jgi:hypothetical protein
LADENDGKPEFFDNSKDTLIHIAQKHGNTALLGKQLKSFFSDYAPQVSTNIKKLVFAAYENGATSILKNNLNSRQVDKERAFKQAVAKLTDNFFAQDAAENIIREFTVALGWQFNLSVVTEIKQGKKRNVQFGGYGWRVLDVRGGKALLLTEDIIEQRTYNEVFEDVTWEKCTLRRYLNNEFYQKFSSQEQTRILPIKNTNANNQWFDTDGGKDTTDKVFLLSIEEVIRYFGDSGQLENKPQKWVINDEFYSERAANYRGKAWWWWLRSPGVDGSFAAYVFADGAPIVFGLYVSSAVGGVRPALWLSLK